MVASIAIPISRCLRDEHVTEGDPSAYTPIVIETEGREHNTHAVEIDDVVNAFDLHVLTLYKQH